jgi:pimeloyl-ACP methyl ester carboxylesterase
MIEGNGGRTLHFELEGEGAPVVFLHGFPLSGQLWTETVQALRADHRCIVPDLRGHGKSEATPTADMGTYAEDVVALLDAVGESRPVAVVALSMGGYVAFEMVRRYPERVRALALVDTRAGPDSPEGARGRRQTAERVLREGSGFVADDMERKLFARDADPELRRRWRDIMASTPPVGVAAALLAMAERPDSIPTLEELGIPVLIVVGEEDAITPPEEARRMQRACPSATLEIVPGAGHMTPVERPEEFAGILRRFLD